ncbi:hypothetical protein ACW180_08300 [Limosilactobacillus fermentum]
MHWLWVLIIGAIIGAIAGAIAPMMAPIIKTHNQCIKHHPLLFFEGCFLDLL